jgi:hypothetical protein
VSCVKRNASLRQYSRISRPGSYSLFQVAPQLYSRGWVEPVPDPLVRKCGSAGNRARDLWIWSQDLWPLDHRGGPLSVFKYDFVWKFHRIPPSHLSHELCHVLSKLLPKINLSHHLPSHIPHTRMWPLSVPKWAQEKRGWGFSPVEECNVLNRRHVSNGVTTWATSCTRKRDAELVVAAG